MSTSSINTRDIDNHTIIKRQQLVIDIIGYSRTVQILKTALDSTHKKSANYQAVCDNLVQAELTFKNLLKILDNSLTDTTYPNSDLTDDEKKQFIVEKIWPPIKK